MWGSAYVLTSDKICPAFFCSNCTEKLETDNHFLQVTVEAVAEDFSCSGRCFCFRKESQKHKLTVCVLFDSMMSALHLFSCFHTEDFSTRLGLIFCWIGILSTEKARICIHFVCDHSNCVRKNKKCLKYHMHMQIPFYFPNIWDKWHLRDFRKKDCN